VRIKLPALRKLARGGCVPGDAEWIDRNADVLGVLLHETGHGRFTSFATMKIDAEFLAGQTGYSADQIMPVVTLIEEGYEEAQQVAHMAFRGYGGKGVINSAIAQSLLMAAVGELILGTDIESCDLSSHAQAMRLAVLLGGRTIMLRRELESRPYYGGTLNYRYIELEEAVASLFSLKDWKVIQKFLSNYSHRSTYFRDPFVGAQEFFDLWFRADDKPTEGPVEPPEGPVEPPEGPGKPGPGDGPDTDPTGPVEPGEPGGEPGGEGGEPQPGGGGESGGDEGSSPESGKTDKDPQAEAVKKILDDLVDGERRQSGGSAEGEDDGDGSPMTGGRDDIRAMVKGHQKSSQGAWTRIRKGLPAKRITWL
ncbi:MAG: hypothetical protein WBB33_02740, partial [Candidatus Saccharimonadales bacterium]